MKLQFEPDLGFQHAAIDAVCDLFTGQEVGESLFTVRAPAVGIAPDQQRLFNNASESGYANELRLPVDELLKNLQAVQLRNGLRQDDAIRDLDFAVEMETGTGKTYVYLRTALELHKRYGWTKFVIIVPSVAIKQGVLKSLAITRDHLRQLYDGVAMESHEYDGSDLSRVRDFAVSRNVRVLVTTVQSIYPDERLVAYQPHEKTGGDRPIDLIRGCNPVVIVDEPQSVEGGEDGQGAKAIKGLKPLAILRYSATHLRKVHEVYRLDAVDAFQKKLVKRIEVAAATARAQHNRPFVKLVGVKTKKGSGPIATIELDVASAGGGVIRAERKLYGNEDLEQETKRELYRNVRIGEIRGGKNSETIELRLPGETRWLKKGETYGGIDPDTFDRLLIERAVTAHLDKELVRRPLGIKVLTLFFVDSVADYREYDENGHARPGRLATAFEEIYKRKLTDPKYVTLFGAVDHQTPASQVHDGYFAKDGKGRIKDTADNARSLNGRDAKEAFDLIMKDKERLLSQSEPLKFIFSHSALREGWDNPNVFQICSLRTMGTERQRRQTLGRGLRLCVNADGARVRDEDLNVLTVVAGESYTDFADRLQKEYEEEGVIFGRIEPHEFARLPNADGKPVGQTASEQLFAALQAGKYLDSKGQVTDLLRKDLKDNAVKLPNDLPTDTAAVIAMLRERAGRKLDVADADDKTTVRPQRIVIESEAFQALWERVRDRTTYRVNFDSEKLVNACIRALRSHDPVERARVQWVTGAIDIERGGVATAEETQTDTRYVDEVGVAVPDAVGLLQERTGLTRATVAKVLIESGRISELRRNPQAVIKLVGDVVEEQKQAILVDGIQYERTGEYWPQSLIDIEFERDLKRLLEGGPKSAFDRVPVDSDIEAGFLRELKEESKVKLFAKLPKMFRVPTPLGAYEPDWVVIVDEHGVERLYFVVETKGSLFESDLRNRESQKIECGKMHFSALAGAHQPPAKYRKARTLEQMLATQ